MIIVDVALELAKGESGRHLGEVDCVGVLGSELLACHLTVGLLLMAHLGGVASSSGLRTEVHFKFRHVLLYVHGHLVVVLVMGVTAVAVSVLVLMLVWHWHEFGGAVIVNLGLLYDVLVGLVLHVHVAVACIITSCLGREGVCFLHGTCEVLRVANILVLLDSTRYEDLA